MAGGTVEIMRARGADQASPCPWWRGRSIPPWPTRPRRPRGPPGTTVARPFDHRLFIHQVGHINVRACAGRGVRRRDARRRGFARLQVFSHTAKGHGRYICPVDGGNGVTKAGGSRPACHVNTTGGRGKLGSRPIALLWPRCPQLGGRVAPLVVGVHIKEIGKGLNQMGKRVMMNGWQWRWPTRPPAPPASMQCQLNSDVIQSPGAPSADAHVAGVRAGVAHLRPRHLLTRHPGQNPEEVAKKQSSGAVSSRAQEPKSPSSSQ
jgi:hypothetical protein